MVIRCGIDLICGCIYLMAIVRFSTWWDRV
jgi:hypothetical protein